MIKVVNPDFKSIVRDFNMPIEYDYSLVRDPSRHDELVLFIRNWYCQQEEPYYKYLNMVTEAIKANNIQAIYTLYRGIDYHDRATGDYKTDLYTAAEHGDMKTLLFVLNECSGGDMNGEIVIKKLRFLASARCNPNPHIKPFAEELCSIEIRDAPNDLFMVYDIERRNSFEYFLDIICEEETANEYFELVQQYNKILDSYMNKI